jgi:serine/threonine-protein kinase
MSLSIVDKERVLGVLPFRYRGPPAQDYLGDSIADELVDVLSRTRGLRVLATGATARFRDVRDPRTVGAELGAGVLIDGVVQLGDPAQGGRVRITVRLVDTAGGVQLWSERYEGDLGDFLTFQDNIARRVAEALRVELTTLSHSSVAPAAAIEHYLAGRHRLRGYVPADALEAVASLERSLELAPDFVPALPAHAIACLRAWFYDLERSKRDWEADARASVDRALARAPEHAETHLAAGIRATNAGDYRAAACSLERALSIAPTYAAAHEYLGMLQCEAARADEGQKRLEQSIALDPGLLYGGVILARTHGLAGRFDRCEAVLEDLVRRVGAPSWRLVTSARIRMAAWRGDHEALRHWHDELAGRALASWPMMSIYTRTIVGEIDEDEARRTFARMLASGQSPRSFSFHAQLAAEVYGALGQIDEARLYLMRAADSVLVDLAWLDGCPLLAALRGHPDYGEARLRVQARADAIWRT